jgi:hypothetical protein
MKIRLTDREIRIRVIAEEVARMDAGQPLVCQVGKDASINLRFGDSSVFANSESGWHITLDRSAIRDLDNLIGFRLADIVGTETTPRIVLEIDRPKRWSTTDRSKGEQASGSFVPASPQESGD